LKNLEIGIFHQRTTPKFHGYVGENCPIFVQITGGQHLSRNITVGARGGKFITEYHGISREGEGGQNWAIIYHVINERPLKVNNFFLLRVYSQVENLPGN